MKGDLLPDDYPVYIDYMYMADNKAIRSDIQGTVFDLKRDLKKQGIACDNIYTYVFEF